MSINTFLQLNLCTFLQVIVSPEEMQDNTIQKFSTSANFNVVRTCVTQHQQVMFSNLRNLLKSVNSVLVFEFYYGHNYCIMGHVYQYSGQPSSSAPFWSTFKLCDQQQRVRNSDVRKQLRMRQFLYAHGCQILIYANVIS